MKEKNAFSLTFFSTFVVEKIALNFVSVSTCDCLSRVYIKSVVIQQFKQISHPRRVKIEVT